MAVGGETVAIRLFSRGVFSKRAGFRGTTRTIKSLPVAQP